MKRSKDSSRFVLNGWLLKFQERSSCAYLLGLERLGFDYRAELDKLSAKQLQLVSSLIVAGSRYGSETSREFRRELKQDKYNKPVYEKRSQFKVIQGGAA
jgi:hypothetical protein